MANIDVRRGVRRRKHPKTGIEVFMYADTPGIYLNAFGDELPESVAREAGFDTDALGKKRKRDERVKAAMAAIDHELEVEGAEETVVVERGGYKVVDYGEGRCKVFDPDGLSLNPTVIPKSSAVNLLDSMVKREEPDEVPTVPLKPKRSTAKKTEETKSE